MIGEHKSACLRASALLVVALAAGGCHGHSRAQVTKSSLARVHKGMTKAAVRDVLGKPDGHYSVPYPTPGDLDEGYEDCWNYGLTSGGEETSAGTSLYQLCFWAGKLTTKARYG